MASNTPGFSCDTCGQRFSKKCNRDRHVSKRVCEKEASSKENNNLSCDTCGQAFTTTSNLNRHVRNVCGKVSTSLEAGLIKCHLFLSEKAHQVINSIPSDALKFNACQYIGLVEKNLYPIIFNDSKNNRPCPDIEALVPREPEVILQSLLLEGENSPIFLR